MPEHSVPRSGPATTTTIWTGTTPKPPDERGRSAAGLTQAEAGRLAGYSAATMSRFETGRQALTDVTVLRRLATVFDIPTAMLGLTTAPPADGSPRAGAKRLPGIDLDPTQIEFNTTLSKVRAPSSTPSPTSKHGGCSAKKAAATAHRSTNTRASSTVNVASALSTAGLAR